MSRPQQQVIAELLATYDERLQQAFMASIASIRDSIVLRSVIERLEQRDVNGAVEVMSLDVDAFAQFELALREAYHAGGIATIDNLPVVRGSDGHRIVLRFGVRNPEAEAWLKEHSSTAITRIVDEQRSSVRAALEEGLLRGDNPRSTALQVVGRIDRASGKRTGGIIGLTEAQERYVAKARAQLLSGDPEQLRAYLERGRRDKRFDRAVTKAIKSGTPVPRATIDAAVSRYSDRLLQLRGEMIARTETMMAIGQSREDAFRQQVAQGKVKASDITKTWHTVRDDRVRHSHAALNGKTVGMDEAFVSPSGITLRFPGDPEAPIREISGCRCWCEYKIDYSAQLLRQRAREAA